MDIIGLYEKPLFMMTGKEFLYLQQTSNNENREKQNTIRTEGKKYVYGIRGIASLYDCSLATAQRIKNSGVLNEAISQIGRKIVIDAELALLLKKNQK